MAAQAFAFRGQDPAARPLEGDLIVESGATRCTDFTPGVYFHNGASPEAQMIADSRQYIDLGDNATLTSADGNTVLTLDKLPANSMDGSSFLQHDILYMGGDPANLAENTFYTPAIAGTSEVPALDLRYGQSITGEYVDTPQLFFPNDFTLTTPAEADYFNNYSFPGDQPLTFEWDTDGALAAGAPGLLSFAAFVDANGKINVYCIKPDDGQLVVPPEALALAPDQGALLVGRFAHLAYENYQDGTRVDMLGITCKYLAGYSKQ